MPKAREPVHLWPISGKSNSETARQQSKHNNHHTAATAAESALLFTLKTSHWLDLDAHVSSVLLYSIASHPLFYTPLFVQMFQGFACSCCIDFAELEDRVDWDGSIYIYNIMVLVLPVQKPLLHNIAPTCQALLEPYSPFTKCLGAPGKGSKQRGFNFKSLQSCNLAMLRHAATCCDMLRHAATCCD